MLTDETLLRRFDSTRWVIAAPGGRNLLVNAAAADLFRLLARSCSLHQARQTFAARFGQGLSAAEFTALIEAQFGGYQLLAADTATARPLLPQPHMRLRLEFIPARLAGRLSAALQPLYAPALFWGTSALLAAGLVAGHLSAGPLTRPQGPTLWVGLGLMYGSMVVHEFGHVAATARAGVVHGGIGCGLYAYLFPVLYADVTGIWLASRQQRIIANLAGIHAQLLYAAVLGGLWLLSGYAPLRFAAGGVSVMALWQFNPFVRHDGYWLLSDVSNTPNLLPRAEALARRALTPAGLRAGARRLVATRGRALLSVQSALLTYGLLNSGLLLFFVLYTCWHSGQLLLSFPQVVGRLLLGLLHGSLDLRQLTGAHFGVLLLYVLLGRSALAWARRRWPSSAAAEPAA